MAKKRDYSAEWKKRPRHQKVAHWNKSSDKKEGRENNVDSKMTKILIEKPCYYCQMTPAGGIDRTNSSLGHLVENCVPACTKCNMILGDLPFSIKQLLAPGLNHARDAGFLEEWIPPPFKP